jgi:uncharacterized protein (TIGR02145 family)/uncharacterized repeat protein (TIGR02543 family)
MRHSLASFIAVVCSIPTILFLLCTNETTSPYDISKTEITVFVQSSSVTLGFSNIEDTVGNTVTIGAQCNWWSYVDSVQLRLVAQTSTSIKDSLLSTRQKVTSLTYMDTLRHSLILNEMGTKTIKAIAYLNNGTIISDSITVIIFPKLTTDDTQPPIIRLLSPVDSAIVTASSLQFKIICKDQSGIAFVKCLIGQDSFNVTNSDSIYSATISGLKNNRISTITFIASDASPRMNKDTLFAHVKYDSISTKNDSNMTIQYDGNGNTTGSAPVDQNSYKSGMSVTIIGNTNNLVKTGYVFSGWNSKIDATGTGYLPGQTFSMGTSNIILYAIWKIQSTLTITYNDSGKTGGNAPKDTNKYAAGDSIVILGNSGNLVKTGYSFAGWNTKADGSGMDYNVGSKLAMPSSVLTIYAKWTTKPTYSVVYNRNGADSGSVPMEGSYEAGASVMVSDNTGKLIKIGFTFSGWTMLKNGTGTSYAPGATFTKGATNDTLFAKWTIATYTVKFNSQGGSLVDSQKVNSGDKVAKPTDPTKTNFTFGGWYKESGYTNTWDFTSMTITTDITLYAKWIGIAYTVKFNSQGGSAVDSIKVNSGDKVNKPADPNWAGHTFVGWYKESGYTTPWEFTSATVSADIVLYAKWTTITYTVKFNSQGGGAVDSIKVNSGDKVNQPTDPSWAGHTFNGWYKESGCTNAWDFASTLVTADMTLYAKWILVYTVTYNVNGGSGTVPVDPNTYSNGSTVSVLSGSGLSRTNYTFSGWNTQADTLGTSYLGGQQFFMGSVNVNLYAKWRMNAPVFTTSLTNKTCPINDSITFTVVATGANLTYKWQKNGNYIDGATASSYLTSALTLAEIVTPPTYNCIVSNSGGSVASNATLSVSTLTDVDGNVYHHVKIGTQVWTMENLRVTKYNDNSPIPLDTSTATWGATTSKYCYYNNTSNAESIKKFGALYNWYVVSPSNSNKIAPTGWHVPTDAQWDILQNYLIANGYNWDGTTTGNKIAKSMAAKMDWNSQTDEGAIGKDLSMNNRSSFSALPSGYREYYGIFSFQSIECYWWSATERDETQAWTRFLDSGLENLVTGNSSAKGAGFSVRLLKD